MYRRLVNFYNERRRTPPIEMPSSGYPTEKPIPSASMSLTCKLCCTVPKAFFFSNGRLNDIAFVSTTSPIYSRDWDGFVMDFSSWSHEQGLRQQGLRLVVYLDDVLIIGSSEVETRKAVKMVVGLFESLGFVIQLERLSAFFGNKDFV